MLSRVCFHNFSNRSHPPRVLGGHVARGGVERGCPAFCWTTSSRAPAASAWEMWACRSQCMLAAASRAARVGEAQRAGAGREESLDLLGERDGTDAGGGIDGLVARAPAHGARSPRSVACPSSATPPGTRLAPRVGRMAARRQVRPQPRDHRQRHRHAAQVVALAHRLQPPAFDPRLGTRARQADPLQVGGIVAAPTSDRRRPVACSRGKATCRRWWAEVGGSASSWASTKAHWSSVRLRPTSSAGRAFLFVLQTGIPWEDLPKGLGFGSGMTCWRRLASRRRLGPTAPGIADPPART